MAPSNLADGGHGIVVVGAGDTAVVVDANVATQLLYVSYMSKFAPYPIESLAMIILMIYCCYS
eukprot:scaffold581862_cov15-Prasinocladus_malaysianus.AAC.1